MKPLPNELDLTKYTHIDTAYAAVELLDSLSVSTEPVYFDFETTDTNVFAKDFEVLSVAFALNENTAWFIPLGLQSWSDEDRISIDLALSAFLLSEAPKVAQNLSYEDLVARVAYTNGRPVTNWEYDTMVGSHVKDERRGTTGLDFQTFVKWGVSHKGAVDVKNLKREPVGKVAVYNTMDTRVLPSLMSDQLTAMSDGQRDAYDFFHDSLLDMVDAEWVGMRVDFDELESFEAEAKERLAADWNVFRENEIVKSFQKRRGREPKPSGDDAIELVYTIGNVPPLAYTASGKPSMRVEDLTAAKDELVRQATMPDTAQLIEAVTGIGVYEKLLNTYAKNLRELAGPGGIIHPSFMLHTVETYRSSSAGPNFQNFPKRSEFGALIRRCIKPIEPFDLLLEGDLTAAEWTVGAMLANDEVMLDEIRRGFDPHRYWASLLLEKDESEITKADRYVGKNGLVFPWRYGAWYKSIAKATGLPEARVDNVIKKMEQRYKRTAAFIQEQLEFYRRNLYVETPLGFRRHAPLSKNQVLNTTSQATSFHLLLAGIHKVNAELHRPGWESLFCGQIHDSAFFATRLNGEGSALLKMADAKMTEIHFPKWQKLPVQLEWAAGANMGEMKNV